jgi:hypothetical protein
LFHQQDIALTPYAISMHGFLVNSEMTVVQHPFHAPDLVLCDLFLFLKLKMVVKGKRLNDITIIQATLRYTLLEF